MATLTVYPGVKPDGTRVSVLAEDGVTPIPNSGAVVEYTGYYQGLLREQELLSFDPDEAGGAPIILTNSDGLALTSLKTVDYDANFGDLVLLGTSDPEPHMYLPLASGLTNGRVGVIAVTTSTSEARVQDGSDDTIYDVDFIAIAGRQTLIFQSDGVSKWWIVSGHQVVS